MSHSDSFGALSVKFRFQIQTQLFPHDIPVRTTAISKVTRFTAAQPNFLIRAQPPVPHSQSLTCHRQIRHPISMCTCTDNADSHIHTAHKAPVIHQAQHYYIFRPTADHNLRGQQLAGRWEFPNPIVRSNLIHAIPERQDASSTAGMNQPVLTRPRSHNGDQKSGSHLLKLHGQQIAAQR